MIASVNPSEEDAVFRRTDSDDTPEAPSRMSNEYRQNVVKSIAFGRSSAGPDAVSTLEGVHPVATGCVHSASGSPIVADQ